MAERLAALGAGKFLEFSMNKVPKCPHCGADFDIDRNEVDCPVCNENFTIQSHADWRFSTDEQDEE